jgi:hypothetical protein
MITEDLDLFFQDFGVPVLWQKAPSELVSALGILDMPDAIDQGTLSIGTDFAVIVQTAIFEGITEGTALTVNGIAYKLHIAPLKLSDGKLCVLGLNKT